MTYVIKAYVCFTIIIFVVRVSPEIYAYLGLDLPNDLITYSKISN